jgi:hypothetical protein
MAYPLWPIETTGKKSCKFILALSMWLDYPEGEHWSEPIAVPAVLAKLLLPF